MAKFDLKVFSRLKYWVQMALPLVYDDSLSYMELLAKVVDLVNGLGDNYNELLEVLEEQGNTIVEMQNGIAELTKEIEAFKRGEYITNYIDALKDWIDNNLIELISRSVKFVQFGLTNDGYFYADIPENWDFLTFGTIYDANDTNYLHLYIEY